MDRAIWQTIADKWDIVMMAPQAFAAALLVGAAAGWLLARTIYNNRLTHHQELISNYRDILDNKLPTSALRPFPTKRSKRMSFGLALIFLGIGTTLIGATIVTSDRSPSASKPSPSTGPGMSGSPPAPQQTQPSIAPTKSVLVSSRYYSAQNKEDVAGRLDKISSVMNNTGNQILELAEVALNKSPWDRPGETIAPYVQRMDEIAGLTIEMHKALYDQLIDKEREYRVEMNAILFPKEPFTAFQVGANEFRNGLSVWMRMQDTDDQAAKNELIRLVQASRMSFGTARDKFLAWLSERQQIINQTRRALRS
jgi:hypothetical protein